MHNAAFRAAHHDAVYIPLAASDFDDFMRSPASAACRRQRHGAVQGQRVRDAPMNAIR
jgi:hypothetical protein